MGFISYSLAYYKDKIEEYENCEVNPERLYEARQLLKMVDDFKDEGYTAFYVTLESEINGVKRLKKYLKDNGLKPFALVKHHKQKLNYSKEEKEINYALESFVDFDKEVIKKSDNAFIDELIEYGDYIGYENDVAYVFLLRDSLIPYMHYKYNNKYNIYPWLIGRKMLKDVTSIDDYDDCIRNFIISALESKIDNYDDFINYVCPRINEEVKKEEELYFALKDLLDSIPEDKIMVVESGCYGTMPLLLKSLDKRVDFRMFTTVPYLKDIYKDKIYTNEYEKLRLFETLTCQDDLFEYAGFHDNRFFVYECLDDDIINKSKEELKRVKENGHNHV